jgi:hypothetical protein
MTSITISRNGRAKNIKPLHCATGGPIQRHSYIGNFEHFKQVGFPYVRLHDCALFSCYGSHHVVDISGIFPDFDKDAYDESSYDFTITDKFLNNIRSCGSDIFYRLGQSIEHWVKKYGSNPPKDFKKWAVICEHIIRHYNEGWCNGFFWNIKYWEIWCEPDNMPACWTGNMREFYDLYEITAKHIKNKIPNVLVGGPGFAEWSIANGTLEKFIKYMSENDVPLDFLSWHTYSRDIEEYTSRALIVRELLDKYGYIDSQSILDEFNYLINWTDGMPASIKKIIGIEGACLVSSLMATLQNMCVDMLFYYDTSPSVFNGIFNFYDCKPLKAYYVFLMFSWLYELQTQILAASDDKEVYVLAAGSRNEYGIMITYYSLDESEREKELLIDLGEESDTELDMILLDKSRSAEKTQTVFAHSGKLRLSVSNNSVVYLRKKP